MQIKMEMLFHTFLLMWIFASSVQGLSCRRFKDIACTCVGGVNITEIICPNSTTPLVAIFLTRSTVTSNLIKVDSKLDSVVDLGFDPRTDLRIDPQVGLRVESKDESQDKSRDESRDESKDQSRDVSKDDSKVESRDNLNIGSKDDLKGLSSGFNQQDSWKGDVLNVHLQCHFPDNKWKLDLLPQLNLGPVNELVLVHCPLIENGFNTVMSRLGAHLVDHLKVDSPIPSDVILDKYFFNELLNVNKNLKQITLRNSSVVMLDENVFDDFNELETLIFELNLIPYIPDNIFSKMSQLKNLFLNKNTVNESLNKVFNKTSNLLSLDLSSNNIDELETSDFNKLTTLHSLRLNNNNLKSLPEHIFDNLTNLTNVYLNHNNLNDLQEDLFKYNRKLRSVDLSKNLNIIIPKKLFMNLTELKSVDLGHCNIKTISSDVFYGCENLKEITLNYNSLETLPENLFRDTVNLKVLDLSHNKISDLANDTFKTLVNLKCLNMEENRLKKINGEMLKPLKNLINADFAFNSLTQVDKFAFKFNMKLKYLYLGDNELSFDDWNSRKYAQENTPFLFSKSLENLHLENNKIKWLYRPWLVSNLRYLDLKYNKISELQLTTPVKLSSIKLNVDLRHNNISKIMMDIPEVYLKHHVQSCEGSEDSSYVIIDIDNNPVKCDCGAFNLVKYFDYLNRQDKENALRAEIFGWPFSAISFSGKFINGKSYNRNPFNANPLNANPFNRMILKEWNKRSSVEKPFLLIKADNLRCFGPIGYENTLVSKVKPDAIRCPVKSEYYCPHRCMCSFQPSNKALIVDCSYRGYRRLPKLDVVNGTYYNQIKLSLQGNVLTTLEKLSEGYDNVTDLILFDNKIRDVRWIPPNVEKLLLHNNHLSNINPNLVSKLTKSSTLRFVTLHNNPWKCDCSIIPLRKFILHHKHKVLMNDLTCSNLNQPLLSLMESVICKNNTNLYLLLVVLITGMLLIALLLRLFLYRLLLWYTTKGDQRKTYDAFICYSKIDGEFVEDVLVKELETGLRPYKLHLQHRDLIPQDELLKQLEKYVGESRRTILVVSPNFLSNVWSQKESRLAYETALREQKGQLIVILNNMEHVKSPLFEEMKIFLKTSIHVSFGDKEFWKKLCYALPQKKYAC